jgi:site-specific DNA recombinase
MLSTTPAAPAVYVRWSTDEQGSGTTLDEQKQTCLAFLSEREWPVRQDLLFIDEGYSAGSLERPAMKKLRRAVHAGLVDAVVVYKLDRLTRNIVDAVELVLKEWEGRCALVSVTQSSIDTTNALGRQFFTLMASFAEFEREMIRDRTMSGKKRRAMQGRNPGFRPPYGYIIGDVPGQIIVDEEKAAVVRRIYDLYVSGIGLIDIANRLNREHLPPPGESRGWTDRTLRYMLTNPLYMGRLEYGKSSKNSPQKRSIVGKSKTYYKAPRHALVQEAVPPIIAPDLWNLTQTLMKDRSKPTGFVNRAATSPYLLTGLLKCRCCGYGHAGVTTSDGVSYYRCRGPQCDGVSIRCDVLDEAVIEAVRHQLQARVTEEVMEAAAAKLDAARASLETTVANLQTALAGYAKQREKARRDYMEGDLTGKILSQFMAELDEKEGEARAVLREAEHQLANPDALAPDTAWLMQHKDQVMSETWAEMEMGQKKQTLRTLVKRLTAFRGKGETFVDLEVTVATPDSGTTEAKTYTWEHFPRVWKETAATVEAE